LHKLTSDHPSDNAALPVVNSMRILIYSYNYHPEPIGIAPLMTELAEGLVARGHDVRVVTGMPNYPQRRIYDGYRGKLYSTEQLNGVTVQRSYVWARPKPGLMARILLDGSFVVTSIFQAIRGWKPDVILLTVPPLPVCVPAAIMGWLYSCPIVLNLQDILPEAAVQVGLLSNRLAIRVFEALERFAYRSATAISVITDGFTDNLVGKGVAQDKITCIPNWVDIDFIRPLPSVESPFRKEHNLGDKFVAMYCGNIALTQGLKTVIRAAARLRHVPDIVFVIIGEESALEELRLLCVECETDNVMLLPFQPREQLPQMLAAADVGLIVQKANVVSFNMPSKTQILLASGRPIVASVPLNGTAAKAIQLSQGGVVVAPERANLLADAVFDLYQNSDKACQLGERGRKHAIDQYSFAQSLKYYEALFEKVVAKQGSNQLVSSQSGTSSEIIVES
jgi:colanic acid biosynthesis glycosyl transferase WcaI